MASYLSRPASLFTSSKKQPSHHVDEIRGLAQAPARESQKGEESGRTHEHHLLPHLIPRLRKGNGIIDFFGIRACGIKRAMMKERERPQ